MEKQRNRKTERHIEMDKQKDRDRKRHTETG